MIGRVYCIRSHQTTDIYIGSTIRELSSRMASHRYDYNGWLKEKMNYITSFEIVKFEDCYIELIEQGEFASKQEMEKREGHFIREMDCINKRIEGRTKKEWRMDNAVGIKEEKSKYYIKNKKKILKKYTCACGKECTHGGKKRHERSAFHLNFISTV